jgi:hypothetical protein
MKPPPGAGREDRKGEKMRKAGRKKYERKKRGKKEKIEE